jgi:zinc protease
MMKHDAFPEEEKGKLGYLVQSYLTNVISRMMSLRLHEMTQEESCSFFQAYADDGQYLLSKTKDCFELIGVPKEGKDMETLQTLYREAKRAREFGFTATEYARAQADYLSALEKQYTNRDKRRNAEFGDQYRDHYLSNEPIPPLDVLYQMMQQIAPNIPVAAVNQLLPELISVSDSNLVVMEWAQEKEGKVYPTEKDMAAAIAAARAEKVEAYVDNVKDEPLVDVSKIKAGKIVKETENKVLGYKELTLSNGATVILKKTDFKDDEIQMQASSMGGKSLYGPADYTNLKVFDQVIGYSGIGNFSSNELTKALAGKEVNADASLGNTRQYITAHSTPKDIETMMQMQYLYFTAINKDEKQFQNLMTSLEMALKNKNLNPEAVFSDSLSNTIYSHNPRFANIQVEDLKNISYDRILEIAKDRFKNAGQFTFVFAGNFDEQVLRPLIEQYIASLPATKQKAEDFKEIMTLAKGEVVNNFKVKTESPKAIALEYWYADMPYTLENSVKLDAVGQILSMIYLKTIREDESAAYSCGAAGNFNLGTHQPKAILQGYCPMNPDKQEIAIRLLHEGIAKMQKAIDADQLAKAKEYMLKQVDVDAKKNNFWINTITAYKEYGIDFFTDYKKTVESLTVNNLRDFLNKMLKGGNHIEVIMLPESK